MTQKYNIGNNLIQLHNLRSPQILIDFMVDIIQEFDCDFNAIFEKVRNELIRRELEIEKKSTAVEAKTNIKRYHIRKYKNNCKKETSEKITKSQLMLYLRQELNTFCRNKGRKWLYPTEFKRVTTEVAGRDISSKVCFDILEKQGLIEQRDDGNYFLCDFDPTKYTQNIDVLEIAVPIIRNLLHTMKLNCSSGQSMRLFQREYFSTQIPPDKSHVVDYLAREKLIEYFDALKQIIDDHEELDVKAGTYKPVGVGLTQFNLNKLLKGTDNEK